MQSFVYWTHHTFNLWLGTDAMASKATIRMLINDNKMDGQINEFVEKFNINNTDENKNQIKEYYNYFLNVKSVFL